MRIVLWLWLCAGTLPLSGQPRGLEFLRFQPDAVSLALGTTHVAASEAEALAAQGNPALLGLYPQWRGGLGYQAWIGQTGRVALALSGPVGPRTGWSVLLEVAGPLYAENEGARFGRIGLACGHRLASWLALGLSSALALERLPEGSRRTVLLTGSLWASPRPYLRIGLKLEHTGRPRGPVPFPESARTSGYLGLGLDVLHLRTAEGLSLLLVRCLGEGLVASGSGWEGRAGLELWLPGTWLVLRAGYRSGPYRGPSLGLGLEARGWSVAYAWAPFPGGYGTTHSISLSTRWP